MAMAERPASFLPTIKCSSCGREVEISLMGEHICGQEPAGPKPPANFDQFLSYGTENNSSRDQDRPGRLPPNVDTSAANRSYYRTGQLTPVSNSSGSQAVSPKTPIGMRNGVGGKSNDDYTPLIANEYDSPSSQQRRRVGYGGLNGSDGSELDLPYPAGSPKKPNGQNFLQRMNSIAPGPFEITGQKTSNNLRNAFPSRGGSNDSTSSSNSSGNDYRDNNRGRDNDSYGSSFGNSTINNTMPSSRKPQRKDGYGGFGSSLPNDRPAFDDEENFEPPSFSRAGTFPRLNSSNGDPLMRTPSAPGTRFERRRQPSNDSIYEQNNNNNANMPSRAVTAAGERMRRPSIGPDLSRPPPPRTGNVRPRTSGRDGSSNSPQVNLAAEFGIGNPYHARSDSMSSSISSLSRPGAPFSSSASSFSSASSTIPTPSTTSAFDRNRPKPPNATNKSNLANFDSLLDDLQSMNSGDQWGTPTRTQQDSSADRTAGSLRGSRRPFAVGDDYNSRTNGNNNYNSYNSSTITDTNKDNGDDGRRDRFDDKPPTPTLAQSRASRNQRPVSRGRDRSTSQSGTMATGAGYGIASLRERSGVRDRSAGPPVFSRGICKACSDPISGKSVSSADGRLTGRYHKACFVCTTCSEPFTSSTFYVHDDKPYCERHYHEVNGSLCGSCGNGIEGQYLADEVDTKYHMNCFVCADCNMPLKDGYFEVAGKAYCERDAWKRVQSTWLSSSGGGGANAEQGQNTPSILSRSPPSSNNGWLSPASAAQGLPSRPGPGGLPSRPGITRTPSNLGNSMLAPPGSVTGTLRGTSRPFGLPSGNRLGPRPKMEKRMTRLGTMN